MKKLIIILFIITLSFIVNHQNEIVVPASAIRFRIIANSNSLQDQTLKATIKNELVKSVIPKIVSAKDITSSRSEIKDSIPAIETTLKKYNVNYQVNYGSNYFPAKTYNGVEYPAGNYESLVITLGSGAGDNWWCVLYPPLCLVENDAGNNTVAYKSLIKEIITKYLP
jgi:stage II sporulation protein R